MSQLRKQISHLNRAAASLRATRSRATKASVHYFDREDTALMPWVVADTVVGDVERAFTDDGLPDRDAIIAALDKRARETYTANERFAKKIRSNANRGNAGRDHLYAFMRHWLSGELGRRHPSIARQLPDDFKMGRELSAVGRWGRPYEKLRSRAVAPMTASPSADPEDRTPHGVPGSCGHCAFWSADPEALRAHRETCTWREAFFQSGGMRPPYGG